MQMGLWFDDAAGRDIPDGFRAYQVRKVASDTLQDLLATPDGAVFLTTMSVAERDYVVQRATEVGLTAPLIADQPRHSGEQKARQWLLGFLDWWRTAPAHTRADTTNHRRVNDDWNAGILIEAKALYGDFPWSADYVRHAQNIWRCKGVTDDHLKRVSRLCMGAKATSWQEVDIELGSNYTLRLPHAVTYSSKPYTLGWEIVHDWILPKDANHGVSILTISFMLAEHKKLASVGSPPLPSVRPNTVGFKITSGSGSHIIALGKGTGDVVTCYRV